MENNKEQLNKLAKFFGADRIISAADIQAVLSGIVKILANNKVGLDTMTAQMKTELSSLLTQASEANIKILNDIKAENASSSKTLADTYTSKVAEINALTKKISKMVPKAGKDADPEAIIQEVLNRLPPPPQEMENDDDEDDIPIVDQINALPVTEQYQIDASHIKNLPQATNSNPNGGGFRNLFQQHDVNIPSPSNGDVLTYNSTTKVWENKTSSGGTSIGGTITGGTNGSVLFVNPNATIAQNKNNFYVQNSATTPQQLATNTNFAFSVNTGGDFTGVDSINTYAQIDAFLPNSSIINTLTGLNTDGATSGFTASSARGTGASPIQLQSGDLAGGFSGWGAIGASSPTYQNLGGMFITAAGSSTNNLGGQLNWYTKGDGGALQLNMYMFNNGNVHIGNVVGGSTLNGEGARGLELDYSDNGNGGVALFITNTNSGTNAFTALNMSNDLANDDTFSHFAGMFYTSSGYNYTGFGTAFAVANQLQVYGTDGPTLIGTLATGSAAYVNIVIGGAATTNEVARFNTLGLSIGTQTNATSRLTLGGAITASAWGVSGINLQTQAATYTDSTGSSQTNVMVNSFGIPTITTSTNAITYTNAATVYIAGGIVAGTNVTFTNSAALWVAGGRTILIGGVSTSTGTTTSNIGTASGNSIGVATSTAGILFGGAANVMYRVVSNGSSSTTLTTGVSYANSIVGASPVTTFSSGTHAWLANQVVTALGTVTSGGATITNTASLYIDAASVAGSNNYALYVNSGLSELNGGLIVGGGNLATSTSSTVANLFVAPGGSATGAISNATWQFAGSTNNQLHLASAGNTSVTLATGSNFSNVFIGSSVLTTFSSGTHAWIVNMVVNSMGTITSGGATVTNTATLYVGAPGSGGSNNYALYVNGLITGNSATLYATTTTFTNGAGASAGTITNAPSVGNPTKWIPINDNGTTRYIPAW